MRIHAYFSHNSHFSGNLWSPFVFLFAVKQVDLVWWVLGYSHIIISLLPSILFFWCSVVDDWCFWTSRCSLNLFMVFFQTLPAACNPDGFPANGQFSISLPASSSARRPTVRMLCHWHAHHLTGSRNVGAHLPFSAHWWDVIYVDSTLHKLPSVSFAFFNSSSPSCITLGWTGRSSGIETKSLCQQWRSHLKLTAHSWNCLPFHLTGVTFSFGFFSSSTLQK